jgi:hypothetical protein
MQQFLLPASAGGGSQIINIPVNLLNQQAGGHPVSFISSNGQLYQLPNICKCLYI